MANPGRNRGLIGIIDCQPIDVASPYPLLQVDIQGFTELLPVTVITTTGPGDAFNEKVYGSNIGGGGTASGTIFSAQRPFPENIYNLQGTLRITSDSNGTNNAYIQSLVLIESLTCKQDTKSENNWQINLVWRKNGPITMVWNGSGVTYTLPTLVAKETNDGTLKVDDPNNLVTAATTHIFLPTFVGGTGTQSSYTDSDTAATIAAYIAGATPPRTSLKVVSTTFMRLDDAVGWLVVNWALRDSKDELLFPRDSEFRSAIAPWRSSQAALVVASGTLASQATSLWATFQSVSQAYGLTLTPYTDGKRVAVYEYQDPGILIEGYTTGGGRYLKTKLNGTSPQVYVASNISRGSGQRKIQLAMQWCIDKPVRRFLIRRFLQGTTLPEQYPSQIHSVTMPAIGDTNSATFLGLAAGTVIYDGPTFSSNLGLSGTLPFFMGYEIHADAAGIAQGLPDIWFKQPILLPINATNVGWTNVATLGLSDVVTPNASSFAAFIA